MISLFFGELYNYPLGIENSDSEEDHANNIVRVNKFDNLQKLYLQTIISVFHICIMKYCFYKLK